jgi:hypothetical protein
MDGEPPGQPRVKRSSAQYITELVTHRKMAEQVVRDRLLRVEQQRQSENVQMTNVPTYQVGDKVLVHNPGVVKPGLSRKLSALWTGPFEVIDSYNNHVNYKVHPLDKLGRKINAANSRLVHVSRLKKYYPPETSSIRLSDVSRS